MIRLNHKRSRIPPAEVALILGLGLTSEQGDRKDGEWGMRRVVFLRLSTLLLRPIGSTYLRFCPRGGGQIPQDLCLAKVERAHSGKDVGIAARSRFSYQEGASSARSRP